MVYYGQVIQLLEKPKNFYHIKNFFGFTKNIQKQIIEDFKVCCNQTFKASILFKGANNYETCKNIFDFFKKNIKFIEDQNGIQDIKSPSRLILDKYGDCKSFSICIGSILWHLGIPFSFRFASYDNVNITHVYIVAYKNVIIDATLPHFNYENKFAFCQNFDYMNTSRVASVNGYGVGLGLYNDYTSYQPVVKTGIDWTEVIGGVVQVLPKVLNPQLAQNQNNPVNAEILAQQIAQNQQAVLLAQQNAQNAQISQNQNFSLQNLLSNPIFLAGIAYLISQYTKTK